MQRVINGRRYDTAKALEVGCSDNMGSGVDSISDFGYWQATLYKTPRAGRFFLAGAGGPMTRFSRMAGQNQWTGGEGIQEMDEFEALAWAEAHLPDCDFERFFMGLIEEG